MAIVNEALGRAERIFLAHGINPHKQVSRFTLLGSLELIAEEIEDPFGTDDNDLPMAKMASNIGKNVEAIIK